MVITTFIDEPVAENSCGRPHFEWLLQRVPLATRIFIVVEGHILSGYYNPPKFYNHILAVVEGHILSGYYN